MRPKLAALLALLALSGAALAACGSDTKTVASSTTSASAPAAGKLDGTKITVGSFGFSESETLAQVYGGALKAAGADVTYKLKLGAREVVAPALEKGDIDLVPEYLGNYLAFLDKTQTTGIPTGDALAKTKAAATAKGITVADTSPATDGDVIAVTKDFATKSSLTTISDLAKVTTPLTLAGPSECETRQTCLLGLKSTYGLKVSFTSTGQDAGGPVTKKALDDGKAQIARLFSSDTDVAAGGKYVVLKDDKQFQQAGNVVPVLRTDKATPAVLAVLNKVSASLDDAKLIALNKKTDIDKEDAATVAAAYLKAAGLS